ncbi:P-type conjugative transfer ATPase TrbB [Methylobacter psychrophilus]|uniref:P-type conjugative transfer ATPase TrbB n=1 Tax=Methylobacter psychrophilus TaxID=96941 RepID=UPI0021D4A0B7|nr:P-type conjugative transfer ATPase TrbB [Methylobacter psychrophilus]
MPNLPHQDDQLQDSVKARAKIKLERDLGPDIMAALADPKTVEIMLNSDGKLWQERLGEKMRPIGTLSVSRSESIIKTIAGFHGKEITKGRPLIECELPLDGSRFAGQFPPIVPAPTFAIRKKAVAIFTLDHYVATGIMSQAQLAVIETAVKNHRNILVTGSTGSGKTTLVNAIINHMVIIDPTERIVIIEDTGEIQCAAENFVQYHTTFDITMTMLLRTTLRMRPDRILVGEVRGPEALDLLMAWNTGHEGGAATLHANNARAGLDRLALLISMHPDSPKQIEPLIGEAVHCVIHIARTQEGRRITEIVEILRFEDGKYITQTLGA